MTDDLTRGYEGQDDNVTESAEVVRVTLMMSRSV